jgi:hypothetical protein|tara:strand:- start:234 stop:599 length:366 start_codon:yes stop_codon:yes gene_type:complete
MTEYQLHLQIIAYLQMRLPAGSVIHHSPNEGNHKIQYRVKQKRMGVRAGWPDLELFVSKTWWQIDVPWSPIFIEIKTQKGVLSANQKQVQTELRDAGCHVATVKSLCDVVSFLNTLMRDQK